MHHSYLIDNSELTIAVDPKTKSVNIKTSEGIDLIFDNPNDLLKGITFKSKDQSKAYFIKYINEKEGFSIIINGIHIEASAGHPKKLLKRTLMPLLLGLIIITLQGVVTYFDITAKGELDTHNSSLQPILYLYSFALSALLSFIGIILTVKGAWIGVRIASITLFYNLISSVILGFYYGTGFNFLMVIFIFGYSAALILLLSHTAIISAVKQYSSSIKINATR